MLRAFVLALALTAPATACESLDGGTDVAGLIGSQFVLVSFDEADADDAGVASEGAINPDTFLANLRAQLGRAPTSVGLTAIRADVTGSAEGVAAWTEVFAGDIVVMLVPQSGAPITAGTLTPAAGLGRLTGRVLVDRADLDLAPDIAAGRFAVRLSGPSARSGAAAFSLPVRVELELLAF